MPVELGEFLERTAYRHDLVSSHNKLFIEKNRSIIEKQLIPVHSSIIETLSSRKLS